MFRPWFDIVQRKFDKKWLVWEKMKDPAYEHVRFPRGVDIPKAWVIVFAHESREACASYVKSRLDQFQKENPRYAPRPKA